MAFVIDERMTNADCVIEVQENFNRVLELVDAKDEIFRINYDGTHNTDFDDIEEAYLAGKTLVLDAPVTVGEVTTVTTYISYVTVGTDEALTSVTFTGLVANANGVGYTEVAITSNAYTKTTKTLTVNA